jgi:hypothetical protein
MRVLSWFLDKRQDHASFLNIGNLLDPVVGAVA